MQSFRPHGQPSPKVRGDQGQRSSFSVPGSRKDGDLFILEYKQLTLLSFPEVLVAFV